MIIGSALHHRSSGVNHAALVLAIASIASGLLGLVRDRLLASHFGASRALDIYYASFRVPDFIFTLMLFLVATTACIPLYLEHKNRSNKEARDFFDSIFTFFCFAALCIIVAAFFIMPYLLPLVAPGFDDASWATMLTLSRIMLLSPLLLGISSLVSSIIQAERRFVAFALAPIFYNVGIIVGIVWFVPRMELLGLALGVVLGGVLHLLIQLPALRSIFYLPRLRFTLNSHPLRMVKLSFPRALSLSLNQMSLLVLTALGSTLGAGSIAVFNLSYNLAVLPIMIIGLSYSIAAFPGLTERAIHKKDDEFYEGLVVFLRHIFFWTIPITALFLVLRAHIVRIVLGAGAFGWVDTRLTIASLFIFAFAIVAQSATPLFIRAYHALGRPRETIRYNIISACVTIATAFFVAEMIRSHTAVSYALGTALRIADIAHYELLALPIGFLAGSLTQAYLLGANLFVGRAYMFRFAFYKIVLASMGMAAAAYATLRVISLVLTLDTFAAVFAEMTLASLVAGFCGVWLFTLLRIPEFMEIKEWYRARFSGEDIMQSDIEHL